MGGEAVGGWGSGRYVLRRDERSDGCWGTAMTIEIMIEHLLSCVQLNRDSYAITIHGRRERE